MATTKKQTSTKRTSKTVTRASSAKKGKTKSGKNNVLSKPKPKRSEWDVTSSTTMILGPKYRAKLQHPEFMEHFLPLLHHKTDLDPSIHSVPGLAQVSLRKCITTNILVVGLIMYKYAMQMINAVFSSAEQATLVNLKDGKGSMGDKRYNLAKEAGQFLLAYIREHDLGTLGAWTTRELLLNNFYCTRNTWVETLAKGLYNPHDDSVAFAPNHYKGHHFGQFLKVNRLMEVKSCLLKKKFALKLLRLNDDDKFSFKNIRGLFYTPLKEQHKKALQNAAVADVNEYFTDSCDTDSSESDVDMHSSDEDSESE